MGYGSYTLPDGREAGYNVDAICDIPECEIEIDRGLSFLCGQHPDGHRDPSEPGCGRYYCGAHHYYSNHDCPNTIECPTCEGEGIEYREGCVCGRCTRTGVVRGLDRARKSRRRNR